MNPYHILCGTGIRHLYALDLNRPSPLNRHHHNSYLRSRLVRSVSILSYRRSRSTTSRTTKESLTQDVFCPVVIPLSLSGTPVTSQFHNYWDPCSYVRLGFLSCRSISWFVRETSTGFSSFSLLVHLLRWEFRVPVQGSTLKKHPSLPQYSFFHLVSRQYFFANGRTEVKRVDLSPAKIDTLLFNESLLVSSGWQVSRELRNLSSRQLISDSLHPI